MEANATRDARPGTADSTADGRNTEESHERQRPNDAELLRDAVEQIVSIAKSVVRLAQTQASLTAFMAREKGRLAIIQVVVLLHVWLATLVAWIFFAIFIWRKVSLVSGSPEMAALCLALIHVAIVAGLITYARRLRL